MSVNLIEALVVLGAKFSEQQPGKQLVIKMPLPALYAFSLLIEQSLPAHIYGADRSEFEFVGIKFTEDKS